MKKTAFIESQYCVYDPSLDDIEKKNPNPFPEKMARAIAFIEKNGLPARLQQPKKSKKSTRTTLQNELLTIYTFDPTEEQMLQLKAFLAQLFADKLNASKVNQEVEMVA